MTKGPGILELRVHGVHNTPPGSMLGVGAGDIGQVAGDGLTGFYRSTSGSLPGRVTPDNVAVEAYSWGALTSGASGLLGWVRRAAWLSLLPFALLNLAYWARPELAWEESAHATPAKWSAGLVRVAGLLLTTLLVLASLEVGVDLIAWQCFRGGSPGCPALPGFTDFLAGATWSGIPRRIAVGTLAPLGLIGLLWYLSRSSMARYEDVPDETRAGLTRRAEDARDADEATAPILRHPSLWSGTARTTRLRRLHISFALCVVVAYSGVALIGARPPGQSILAPPFRSLVVLDALAVLVAAVVTLLVGVVHSEDVESATPDHGWRVHGRGDRERVAMLAAAALLVMHLVVLFRFPTQGLDDGRGILGENAWFISVFVGLTALHIAVFLVRRAATWTRFERSRSAAVVLLICVLFFLTTRYSPLSEAGRWVAVGAIFAGLFALVLWHLLGPPREVKDQAWSGAGASVLLAAAVWVGLLFTTSVVTFAADRLNGADSVSDLGTAFSTYGDDTGGDNREYVATGEVVLRGAVLERSAAGVTVRSGTVVVDRLEVGNDVGSSEIALSLSRRQLKDAVIVVPDAPVKLEGSCVPRPGVDQLLSASCSVGEQGFVSEGLLDIVGPPRLRVEAPEAAVTVSVRSDPQAPLVLPQVLVWAPVAQLLWVLMFALVTLGCYLVLRSRVRGKIREQVRGDPLIPRADEPACASARFRAAMVHRAERLLDLTGPWTGLLMVVLILCAGTGQPPWKLVPAQLVPPDVTRAVVGVGLWAALGAAVGLVAFAARMRTSVETRKAAGILWDLTTFWPRAVHPFAPPCYAERVVPELIARSRWVLRPLTEENRLILAGHSQGSTLVAAAAIRLEPDELKRVHVLTYGSQLREWYARIFPAVFGPTALGNYVTGGPATFGSAPSDVPVVPAVPPGDWTVPDDSLYARLGGPGAHRWVNLFRRSDPIGFRVFTDLDSRMDVYVPEVPPPGAGDPGPALMTHGGYQHTPAYIATVDSWIGRLRPPSRGWPPRPPGTGADRITGAPFFPAP